MSFPDSPLEGSPDAFSTNPASQATPPPPPPFAMSPVPPAYAMSQVPGPSPDSVRDSRAFGIIGLVLGIVALIASLLSFRIVLHPIVALAGFLMAVGAVVLGHIGFGRADNGGKGRGIAIAALIVGYFSIAVGLVHLLGLVGRLRFLRRRRLVP